MSARKSLQIALSFLMIATLILGGSPAAAQSGSAPAKVGAAAPASPVDETKVPHYFGPNPNWALSPLTLPDATVVITGTGTGAEAQATVGANGAITGVTILKPGSNYTGTPTVAITSNNPAFTPAVATATVTATGIVTGVTMDPLGNGGGYVSPSVTFTGGGATTQATAIAYGGVDSLTIVPGGGGAGYTMPTIEFDLPDDPNGVQAKAHVASFDPTTGAITSVVLDEAGSGYANAPKATVHDGTLANPINSKAAAAAAVRAQIQGNGGISPNAITATTPATLSTTINILSVVPDTFGAGYTAPPAVIFSDLVGTGTGASATAAVDSGGVTAITVDPLQPGAGYLTPGGIKKFTDALPGLCVPPACPLYVPGLPTEQQPKYIPLAIPEQKTYNGITADEFDIALVQYRTSFSSSLKNGTVPVGTLVRGYVQLETLANAGISQHFPLTNELLNGTKVPVLVNGVQALGVTPPQYLGPIIAATKDKPVRIIFRNMLPTGSDGELFLPADATLMGSGMAPMAMPAPVNTNSVTDEVRNPMCSEYPSDPASCFLENRATLHLHGGISPWISDGTAHQWITPANETTPWPQGVSVQPVPDMAPAGCDGNRDGCMTFYYTNQQSARLLFYHDHAWGITRLNVYAGEAAGYLISDDTEKALMAAGGPLENVGLGIPLVIQDRTFVPADTQLYNQYDANGNVISYGQDPTWDKARWGGYGGMWYHHVYMTAQNPGDPSGMSSYGRWMYGPWFWPPAAGTIYGPIPNPYYNMDPATGFTTPLAVPCDLNNQATWQYTTDPFCEPEQIPGTPNISVGMEQFNDTPIVNGVAYPTVTLEPQPYRFRMLNAANDRFFNFQWYVADPTQLADPLDPTSGTEVALKAAEVAAAQTDPVVFPTPDTTVSLPGPDWVQFGTEGGFLPAPVVVDGQQVTTWITDPTRFDVGNVDLHSLLLAPAERADVVVDFSAFAGKTLILYNDAPAAFPARVPSYDYYTGYPDQSPNGPAAVLPGYGPNTRTIMQVKIAATDPTPVPAFDQTGTLNDGMGKLQAAFKHSSSGTGVFKSGQHPIIVGQAAYNSAYGKNFSAGSNCNAPGSTVQNCDGFVRVSDTSSFGFNTLAAPATKTTMPLQPKAIHDEMNSSTFDEFGRMQANLGIEAQPPTPGLQNVTLYPFVNPATELIDATNLPKADVIYDAATGLPISDVKITPMSNAADGTQIWRITHNGVDTHPIHFHLYDVQVLNRVTWDNIIIPTEPTELGWKDTVRISPLEDTIVALRPIIPEVPWELPNSVHNLNPMMPKGSEAMFNNIDPAGNPTNPIINDLVNFGWEYVYHCHILSHEEMDMMRPVSVALPPLKPDGLGYSITGSGNNTRLTLTWNDNSINETGFLVQRSTNGTTWTDVGTVASPLNLANTHGRPSFTDTTYRRPTQYQYRVVAMNTIGYGLEFPTMTAQSVSDPMNMALVIAVPASPSSLAATLAGTLAAPQVNLTFIDNATNETGFVIQRAIVTNGVIGAFAQLTTLPARNNTGSVSYTDSTVILHNTYAYRVAATGTAGQSGFSNTVTILVDVPAAPSNVEALAVRFGTSERVTVAWADNAINESGFTIQWSSTSNFASISGTASRGVNATTYVTGNIARQVWYFRVRANNVLGSSAWVTTAQIQPAAVETVKSPLVFLNDFTLGMTGWTGQVGTVQTSAAAAMGGSGGLGLAATWGVDEVEDLNQAAYVFHRTTDPLGSYMANFSFNPNGAVTGANPIDIFTGLDANGVEIFGVQYLHTAAAPDLYQVRGWAKTVMVDVFTDWAIIANAEQNIQLDWQSDQSSSLNLYVQDGLVASVSADTSAYQFVEERLGASKIGANGNVSAAGVTASIPTTIYLDEIISLSTQVVTPFTPTATFFTFMPMTAK